MQLGMIGLGRIGASLVQRLAKDGHTCVVYDLNQAAVIVAINARLLRLKTEPSMNTKRDEGRIQESVSTTRRESLA